MALDPARTSHEHEGQRQTAASRGLVPVWRILGFALFLGATLVVFRQPLASLIRMALDDERYTHVIFMPFAAAGLIGLSWRRVLGNSRPAPRLGVPLLLVGAIAYVFGFTWESLALAISAMVIVWIAGFLAFFGSASLQASRFPVALLALVVPLPSALLDAAELMLQRASAEVTEVLFRTVGTPLFRDGMQFAIPGVVIEVARECSGIRSTIVLMLVVLILGYLFLRSNRNRVLLVALAVPISIFKNAIRIVSLSWLGTNVSMDYLTGDLHHRGGPVFSLIALALMVPFFVGLQHVERLRARARRQSGDA
jgi:exosortase